MTERELRADRERTARAAEEALTAYRTLREQEDMLEREGILTTDEKPKGRRLTREEREIEQDALRERRRAAGQQVKQTAEAARRARAAHVNHLLRIAAQEYERAAVSVIERTARVEDAYVALVASAIELTEAHRAEEQKARRMTKLALEAATDDSERAQIRFRATDEVAVALTEDGGIDYAVRPERGLFSHLGDTWRPDNDLFGEEMVSLIRGGRARLAGCPSERVAARISKALNRRTS